MPSTESSLPGESRLLLRLGLGFWWAAAVAAGWELLSLQPPDSPLHWGVLVGPITQLREVAFVHGTIAILLALVWPRLYAEGEARWLAWWLAIPSFLHVAVLCYAAGHGLLAVQLMDPRVDARMALYARGLAGAQVMFGLATVFGRSLRVIR